MLGEESSALGRIVIGRRRAVGAFSFIALRAVELAAKHALDRLMSLLALVALAPFIACVIVVIVASGGRGLRSTPFIGQGGRPIWLCRFGDAPRAPGFSAFLDRSGLRNMPLLFNVLRGDLSFIGPRPNCEPDAPRAMRPGLFTPMMPEAGGQKSSDLEYAERFSLLYDTRIIWAAIRNASGPNRRGQRPR